MKISSVLAGLIVSVSAFAPVNVINNHEKCGLGLNQTRKICAACSVIGQLSMANQNRQMRLKLACLSLISNQCCSETTNRFLHWIFIQNTNDISWTSNNLIIVTFLHHSWSFIIFIKDTVSFFIRGIVQYVLDYFITVSVIFWLILVQRMISCSCICIQVISRPACSISLHMLSVYLQSHAHLPMQTIRHILQPNGLTGHAKTAQNA